MFVARNADLSNDVRARDCEEDEEYSFAAAVITANPGLCRVCYDGALFADFYRSMAECKSLSIVCIGGHSIFSESTPEDDAAVATFADVR